jgi:hypothetical protein
VVMKKPKPIILLVTDEDGNTVEMRLSEDAEIDDWLVAFARILKWQEFLPAEITERLGDF